MSREATRLEEFKALRAEILASFARQETRLSLAWAGVAALVGVAAVSRVPELACLALALVASAWRDALRLDDGVQRIAAYIEVVLEPDLPGLNWETSLGVVRARDQQQRSALRWLWGSATSTYGIFAVICIISTAILFAVYPPSGRLRQAAGGGLAVLASAGCLRVARHSRRPFDERERYRQVFREALSAHEKREAAQHRDGADAPVILGGARLG
jgi:hypothetical protein